MKSWGKSPRTTARKLAVGQTLPGASSNRNAVEGGPPESRGFFEKPQAGVRVRVLEPVGNGRPR